MLRFFRSSHTAVILVIFLLGGLTWLHTLLYAGYQTENRHGMFLFKAMSEALVAVPRFTVWCGLLLTLIVAVLQIYVNRLNLIDKISYLPALCYILLTGGIPAIHLFNPAVIATIFLIIAFTQLMVSFRSEQLSYAYFTAPMCVALAAFFYQYAYIFMLVVWFCLLLFRPGYWREWFFSLIGFLFPFIWLFAWFYVVNDNYTQVFDMFEEMFSFQNINPNLDVTTIIFLIFNTLITILAVGYLLRYIGTRKIIVRNSYYTLLMITVLIILTTFIVPDILPFAWYLVAFPLSFFLSYYLANIRSLRLGNIVLWLLIASVGLAQFVFYNNT
jgi:hypothetical protein